MALQLEVMKRKGKKISLYKSKHQGGDDNSFNCSTKDIQFSGIHAIGKVLYGKKISLLNHHPLLLNGHHHQSSSSSSDKMIEDREEEEKEDQFVSTLQETKNGIKLWKFSFDPDFLLLKESAGEMSVSKALDLVHENIPSFFSSIQDIRLEIYTNSFFSAFFGDFYAFSFLATVQIFYQM